MRKYGICFAILGVCFFSLEILLVEFVFDQRESFFYLYKKRLLVYVRNNVTYFCDRIKELACSQFDAKYSKPMTLQ